MVSPESRAASMPCQAASRQWYPPGLVVCTLTSNLKRSKAPGNVTLSKGEASLAKKSVVNISQVFTVNKNDLSEKIGTLYIDRISQVLTGIRLLTEPREVDWNK